MTMLAVNTAVFPLLGAWVACAVMTGATIGLSGTFRVGQKPVHEPRN